VSITLSQAWKSNVALANNPIKYTVFIIAITL
jgi:hypothetical protein